MLEKLNMENPAHLVSIVFLISLIIIGCLLYFIHPVWVQRINSITGKEEISYELLISYSITFALVCSIISLFITSQRRTPHSTKSYNTESFPSPEMASAYNGYGTNSIGI